MLRGLREPTANDSSFIHSSISTNGVRGRVRAPVASKITVPSEREIRRNYLFCYCYFDAHRDLGHISRYSGARQLLCIAHLVCISIRIGGDDYLLGLRWPHAHQRHDNIHQTIKCDHDRSTSANCSFKDGLLPSIGTGVTGKIPILSTFEPN